MCIAVGFLMGCQQSTDHHGKRPIASIGDTYLYADELDAAIPSGTSALDSARMAKDIVEEWVENTLLYEKAKRNVDEDEQIEQMVEDYRRSLLIRQYEDQLVMQAMGDSLPDEDLLKFYEANKILFKTTEPYVQGILLKVGLQAPQLVNVRKWLKSSKEEAQDELARYSMGNAVHFDYFVDKWKPVSEVSVQVPLPQLTQDVMYLSQHPFVEISDSLYRYFIKVSAFIPQGVVLPFAYARTSIREIVKNQQKIAFLKDLRKQLLQEAKEEKTVKYYK